MEKNFNARKNLWFIERRSPRDDIRLFVFHHAGGGASYYASLFAKLQDKYSIYIVQLPGREYRIDEPIYDSWDNLLNDLSQVITPYLDKPFVFWGHSMGGIIAYELTQIIKKEKGILPKYLFISSCSAPGVRKNNYSKLSDVQLLKRIFALGGTDCEVMENNTLRSYILPILRKDFFLCDNHEFLITDILNVPVTILGGLEDESVGVDDLLNWKKYFDNAFSICLFKGNHFYFKNQIDAVLFLIANIDI